MSEFETPADVVAPVHDRPVNELPTASATAPEAPAAEVPQPVVEVHAVDPVRAAAGRLGAKRRQELIEFGRKYEEVHGLTPGRQRLRQLVQLGKRYEQENGLRAAKPRRKKRGDAWTEFLTALARVIKPAHRPAVEKLVAALSVREAPAGGKVAA
jgi:hypothetical protein